MIEGEVDGVPVQDILVDSGAAKMMVHKDLVSKEKMMRKEFEVSIQCAHRDSVAYPLARVTVMVNGLSIHVANNDCSGTMFQPRRVSSGTKLSFCI